MVQKGQFDEERINILKMTSLFIKAFTVACMMGVAQVSGYCQLPVPLPAA